MGPSCRRITRSTRSSKSSSPRRKTLLKKQNNQENSAVAPVNSSPVKPSNDVGDSCSNINIACLTPKAKRNRIPEIQTCPPAPKKRRMVKSSSFTLRRNTPIAFFASPDIELFFYLALRGIQV
ncbi:hypothetical protein ACJIZ3_012008 [Penstemon smallii]|uniref:Uncharacterized protein n=1 Tax=Penstemon smallii TaxID=265156 RepID=A0ABD3UMX2_9LAMI